MIQNKLSINTTHRYCDKHKFNILLCGGCDYSGKINKNVKEIDGTNLCNVKDLPPMNNYRKLFETVCLKGEVYVFGGYDNNLNWVSSIEKYSPATNSWKEISVLYDERCYFCVCAFMNKIFIFGGRVGYGYSSVRTNTNTCLQFDTKDYKWTEVARMREAKRFAACVVFEGNIVVSGGEISVIDHSNTVESYDVMSNKWSSMPNMIHGKSHHSLVVVRNKLFVIHSHRTNECEVFDNVCKKFVPFNFTEVNDFKLVKAVSVQNKIVCFQNGRPFIVYYDVENDEWHEDSYDVTKNLYSCSFVKVLFN